MTPEQKAYETRKFKLARILAKALADLPSSWQPQDVIDLWRYAKGYGPEIKCAVFWLMDNEPSRFADYPKWHPRLRSVRNDPTFGPKLFEIFQGLK